MHYRAFALRPTLERQTQPITDTFQAALTAAGSNGSNLVAYM